MTDGGGGDRPTVTATVVVPTRDRPRSLARCLEALAAQDATDFEVVVVDDGSADEVAVADVVHHAGVARVRLLRAGGRGPAAARNLGAAAAAGTTVCFTDDDCRPCPGWVASLRRPIEAGEVAVAGPTLVGRASDHFAAASQLVTDHLRGEPGPDDTVHFAPTSNLAVARWYFDEHPFDETFPLAAGEDREWCDRLAEAGHRLRWATDAEVDHHPDLDLARFWRQHVRYGRGSQRSRSLPTGSGLRPPTFYVDLLWRGFRAGPAVGALVVLSQVATAWGALRERLAPT